MIYYVLACGECTPALPMPFSSEEERRAWASAHFEGTGHININAWVQEV